MYREENLTEKMINSPEYYQELSDEEKERLCDWIICNIFPRKTPNHEHSSYKLKHYFEHDKGGFYITNGQFKGAMIACGFEPVNENELNWHFSISQKSPIFHRGLSCL